MEAMLIIRGFGVFSIRGKGLLLIRPSSRGQHSKFVFSRRTVVQEVALGGSTAHESWVACKELVA